MENVYIIASFIFGLVLGSFYHVVGYRLPKGENLLRPKQSYCPECHHPLGVFDLIPVFSYVLHGGKCQYCKKKISISYPVIELITGLLFALSYKVFGLSSSFLIALVLCSMLSIILVSDINYLIIPDSVTITGGVLLIIIKLIGEGILSTVISIGSGILMFSFMYLLMLIGNLLFQKESLGGADIKLMFIAGLVLGPFLSLCLIFVASLIALPVAIILYIVNRENMIPFGPFLMLGMILLYFSKIDVQMVMEWLKL